MLSPRETEIATLVARGLTNRQIAVKLSIGEGTVRNNLSASLAKLGLVNRAELAVWITRNKPAQRGSIPDPDTRRDILFDIYR